MIREDNEGYRNLDEIIEEENLDYETVKENFKNRLKQLAKTKPELAEMIAKKLKVDITARLRSGGLFIPISPIAKPRFI